MCRGSIHCPPRKKLTLLDIPCPPRKKLTLLDSLVRVLDENRGCPVAVIKSIYERHLQKKTFDATARVDNLPGEFKD